MRTGKRRRRWNHASQSRSTQTLRVNAPWYYLPLAVRRRNVCAFSSIKLLISASYWYSTLAVKPPHACADFLSLLFRHGWKRLRFGMTPMGPVNRLSHLRGLLPLYFESAAPKMINIYIFIIFACTELERQLPMHPMENEKSPEDPGLTIDFISGTWSYSCDYDWLVLITVSLSVMK